MEVLKTFVKVKSNSIRYSKKKENLILPLIQPHIPSLMRGRQISPQSSYRILTGLHARTDVPEIHIISVPRVQNGSQNENGIIL